MQNLVHLPGLQAMSRVQAGKTGKKGDGGKGGTGAPGDCARDHDQAKGDGGKGGTGAPCDGPRAQDMAKGNGGNGGAGAPLDCQGGQTKRPATSPPGASKEKHDPSPAASSEAGIGKVFEAVAALSIKADETNSNIHGLKGCVGDMCTDIKGIQAKQADQDNKINSMAEHQQHLEKRVVTSMSAIDSKCGKIESAVHEHDRRLAALEQRMGKNESALGEAARASSYDEAAKPGWDRPTNKSIVLIETSQPATLAFVSSKLTAMLDKLKINAVDYEITGRETDNGFVINFKGVVKAANDNADKVLRNARAVTNGYKDLEFISLTDVPAAMYVNGDRNGGDIWREKTAKFLRQGLEDFVKAKQKPAVVRVSKWTGVARYNGIAICLINVEKTEAESRIQWNDEGLVKAEVLEAEIKPYYDARRAAAGIGQINWRG